MLFFRQLKDIKLSDPEFNTFYSQECHICRVTADTVSAMERLEEKKEILDRLDISPADYEYLKSGDRCNPSQVMRLAQSLGLPHQPLARCPRLIDG